MKTTRKKNIPKYAYLLKKYKENTCIFIKNMDHGKTDKKTTSNYRDMKRDASKNRHSI